MVYGFHVSVLASVTDRQITSGLAIRTLKKAMELQAQIKVGLIELLFLNCRLPVIRVFRQYLP